MSREITFAFSLQVRKNSLVDTIQEQFTPDLAGSEDGPAPGSLLATTAGIDVDFTPLTVPGVCVFKNLDPDNYVEVGIWDGAVFQPFMQLLPGEAWPLRLSPNYAVGYGAGAGTGTTDSGNTYRIKAHTASCRVQVKAYET